MGARRREANAPKVQASTKHSASCLEPAGDEINTRRIGLNRWRKATRRHRKRASRERRRAEQSVRAAGTAMTSAAISRRLAGGEPLRAGCLAEKEAEASGQALLYRYRPIARILRAGACPCSLSIALVIGRNDGSARGPFADPRPLCRGLDVYLMTGATPSARTGFTTIGPNYSTTIS